MNSSLSLTGIGGLRPHDVGWFGGLHASGSQRWMNWKLNESKSIHPKHDQADRARETPQKSVKIVYINFKQCIVKRLGI